MLQKLSAMGEMEQGDNYRGSYGEPGNVTFHIIKKIPCWNGIMSMKIEIRHLAL